MHRPVLTLVGLCLLSSHAFAHGLTLFATVHDDQIVAEASFTDGSPVKGHDVSLMADNVLVTTAITDDEGIATFTAPSRNDYELLLDLGDGHRATYDVKAEYFAPAVPTTVPILRKKLAVDPNSLQGQITQLQDQIENLSHRIGLRDIVGGLGYIIGLVGIWAWFQSKRSGSDSRDGF